MNKQYRNTGRAQSKTLTDEAAGGSGTLRTEGLRDVLLGGAGLPNVLDELAVLAGFIVVLFPLAMAMLRWALRNAKTTGTSGNY